MGKIRLGTQSRDSWVLQVQRGQVLLLVLVLEDTSNPDCHRLLVGLRQARNTDDSMGAVSVSASTCSADVEWLYKRTYKEDAGTCGNPVELSLGFNQETSFMPLPWRQNSRPARSELLPGTNPHNSTWAFHCFPRRKKSGHHVSKYFPHQASLSDTGTFSAQAPGYFLGEKQPNSVIASPGPSHGTVTEAL